MKVFKCNFSSIEQKRNSIASKKQQREQTKRNEARQVRLQAYKLFNYEQFERMTTSKAQLDRAIFDAEFNECFAVARHLKKIKEKL